jgi:hypothetical protein
MHMVTHRPGNADASGWTFGLEPSDYVYRFSMQVSSVGDGVSETNPDADG